LPLRFLGENVVSKSLKGPGRLTHCSFQRSPNSPTTGIRALVRSGILVWIKLVMWVTQIKCEWLCLTSLRDLVRLTHCRSQHSLPGLPNKLNSYLLIDTLYVIQHNSSLCNNVLTLYVMEYEVRILQNCNINNLTFC
jgi:hypothetical protein